MFSSFSFPCKKTEAKEYARFPLILRVVQSADDAAPRAAMRRCPALREFSSAFTDFGESQARSGAHPAVGWTARLASPDALPDGTMLAASID